MYSTKPPSRATFNPRISSLARMPSPPPALRSVVQRLNRTPNRTPTRRFKPSPAIKTEPMDTPSIDSSSDSEHIALQPQQRPTLQTNHSARSMPSSSSTSTSQNINSAGSIPSSTSTSNSGNSALSQALVNLINTPPASNTTPVLDFQGCRVEIHFHVHPTLRPAFPPPYSRIEKLKRKRDGQDVDQVAEGDDILERQVKKIKLSHDSELGYRVRGQAATRKRSERATAADSVKARSRSGLRRMSHRGMNADRVRK